MKKIFLSLIATAMLFSACGNDNENDVQTGETGELSGTIRFAEAGPDVKVAASTAIPVTSWDNVKTIRLFLYKADGSVAFSKDIAKSDVQGGAAYTIKDIPAGTNYKLAIVANVKSSVDAVSTTVTGWAGTPTSDTEFSDANVKGKKINSSVGIDFKKHANLSGIPAEYQGFSLTHVSPSEIFVAYADNVTISSTTPASVTGLALERIVSLMRIRVKNDISTHNDLLWSNANGSIIIYNTPNQINLAQGTIKSGSTTTSDPARILVGAQGANTYLTADPSTTTHKDKDGNAGKVIDTVDGFLHWQEFVVFPNVENTTLPPATHAATGRKYNVVLCIYCDTGHILEDGTTALPAPAKVYWQGDVNEIFTPNKIREVNITLKSGGTTIVPPGPGVVGNLDITVSNPLPWNSVIDQSGMEL